MGPVFSHRILTATILLIFLQTNTYSHEVGARGSQILDWHSDEISRVVSFTPYGAAGKAVIIEGKNCLQGFQFYFDVLDNFAFDVDESVELAIEFDLATSAKAIRLDFDKNGGESATAFIDLPPLGDERFHVGRITLERARFAGRGDFGTDFRISAHTEGEIQPRADRPHTTVCVTKLSSCLIITRFTKRNLYKNKNYAVIVFFFILFCTMIFPSLIINSKESFPFQFRLSIIF